MRRQTCNVPSFVFFYKQAIGLMKLLLLAIQLEGDEFYSL